MNKIKLNQNFDINLALNKPTVQSSVYQPEIYGYDPQGACNGKKTGKFGFHTCQENQPWWQIDLQAIYQLTQIRIYNRINFEERASTLNILLSEDALNWELFYSNNPDNLFGGINGKPLIVDIAYKVARFVRLQLREIESLHLDEVEIYGVHALHENPQLKSNQDESTLASNFYRELRDNLELEKRFAEQNGISLSLMRSQFFNPMFKEIKKTDTLKLSQFVKFEQLDENHIISDITAVFIEKPGRFGNSIIQLSNAYQVAKSIGVYKIYLPNFWYIKSGTTNTQSGFEIINVNTPDFYHEKIVLEGMFFDYQVWSKLAPKSISPPNTYLNMIDLGEAFNLKHSQPLNQQDLVIHIRSGDIFKNPHLNYGQPPLSFYQKIIQHQSWHSINLVFEDKLNHIIEPLIDFCQSQCTVVRQMSNDLRADIEYLLRAKTLVASRGSFCPAIATISKNLETVYYFEGSFSVFSLDNPNVSCVRVIDKKGTYKSKVLKETGKTPKHSAN
ncbi:discoidin domain-containing protein [Limnospira fusiformis]|uniref:discoidin domain-containing protein n=1 Tax=Limnospira fusiformis TaxID=54297 RepID=UPI00296F407D